MKMCTTIYIIIMFINLSGQIYHAVRYFCEGHCRKSLIPLGYRVCFKYNKRIQI